MLPDNVLLEIFHFYRDDPSSWIYFNVMTFWKWQPLTQVCRRWRYIVLGSPRRLDLRVVCTDKTSTRTLLDIWPTFPIGIFCLQMVDRKGIEDITVALEHRDRTSDIYISRINGSALEKLATSTVMHEPFPALRSFVLRSSDDSVPVLPETFLGGSAPRLQLFDLSGIPFPTFPRFILTATHINHLHLTDIPHSGYISPDVMATRLITLPNLEYLVIGFRSPLSRPLQISPPRLTHAILPALTHLVFSGTCEYFEDFVARIDTPLLYQLSATFFLDLIFDIPRLHDFINRTESLGPSTRAEIVFSGPLIKMTLGSPIRFELEIKCERPDWQLSSMTQIFGQQLPLLSHIEHLEIRENTSASIKCKDDPDMDSLQWLELFRLFIAVQSLYVSENLVPPVAAALQELTGGMAIEVLPALHNLSLEGLEPSGHVQEGIQSFVMARQLFGRPVIVVGPTLSDDAIMARRFQNILAARRSRKRKLEYYYIRKKPPAIIPASEQ
jgi:hypothetical protein